MINDTDNAKESSETRTETTTNTNALAAASALTAFRHDILVVLADGPTHGLGLKTALEAAPHYETVHHGRLYPNLDRLAEEGLVEKDTRQPDRRTNEYALTEHGRALLAAYRDWQATYLEGRA